MIAALLSLATDANAPILIAMYLAVAAVGLLAVRGPLLSHGGIEDYGTALRRGFVAESITVNLGVGVLLGLTLWVDNRALSHIPFPTSPYFWGMMAVLATVGLLVLWPLQYWMLRRGFSVWPPSETGATIRLPSWRDSWWMTLTTFALMILTIGIAGLSTG